MHQTIANTLGDGDSLGGKPFIGYGGSAPAEQGSHNQKNERVDPPEPGTGSIGLLNCEGTIAVQLIFFLSHSFPLLSSVSFSDTGLYFR